jgi:hypothetical protein
MTMSAYVSAHAQAMAYVWGRQDAGEGEKDTQVSQDFAAAFAERARAYAEGESGVGFMPNLQSAWETWKRTGKVAE